MKHLISLFALLFTSSSYANPAEYTILMEDTVFVSFSDPGWLTLSNTNGQRYEAGFFYKFISFDNIYTWKKGEPLKVVFAEDKGLGVLREADETFYKLNFYNVDIIEQQEKKCLEDPQAFNTRESGCFANSADMWNTEYQFYYNYILENESDELKEAVVKFDKTWPKYREAFFEAHGIHAAERGGNIYGTYAAIISRDMSKERAKLITELFQ